MLSYYILEQFTHKDIVVYSFVIFFILKQQYKQIALHSKEVRDLRRIIKRFTQYPKYYLAFYKLKNDFKNLNQTKQPNICNFKKINRIQFHTVGQSRFISSGSFAIFVGKGWMKTSELDVKVNKQEPLQNIYEIN